jgi:serpin B
MADLPRASASIDDAKAAAAAINDFGFDLHRRLSAEAGNVVFSPASVAIALGMARAGARGETAAQMDAVLREVASDEHAAWLNGLDQVLAGRNGTFEDDEGTSHELVLDVANTYFAQRDYPLERAFLEALAARFGAGIQLVDFIADSETARRLINEWANEQTRGRIPEVLKTGDVTSATRLALVNAIYLKAPWLRPFQADQTTDEPFTKLDGSTVEVPMMHTTHASCGTGAGWGAFELPYIGNTLSMLVVVPDDLAAFEASLDEAALAEVSRVVRQGFAAPDVTLPRFGFETREELAAVLAELGMPDAFDPDVADFSGMTGARELFIGKVIHQANISVDEKGTEAAAVTVVGMDVTGGPSDICTVHADRPFVFAIRDVETGAILFMGRVVDPSVT